MDFDSPTLKYWVENETEGDLTEIELDPPLEVLDPDEINWDNATRLCSCLRLDPDRVLLSDEKIELPEYPTFQEIDRFWGILVKNYDDYNISEMPTSQVKAVTAILTQYFIKASQ